MGTWQLGGHLGICTFGAHLGGDSEGAQAFKGHSVTRILKALERSDTYGTQALGQLDAEGHSGTCTLRTLRHLGTRALGHLRHFI